MILRRFMKHVTDQNWFAVGLDVIVVIVGIFLGMQITAQFEYAKEREQEILYIERLHVDIIEAIRMKDDNTTYRLSIYESLQELMKTLDGKSGRNAITNGECNALYESHIYADPSVSLPTIEELYSSGRISYILDEEIKAKISGYQIALDISEDLNDEITLGAAIMAQEFPEVITMPLSMSGMSAIQDVRLDGVTVITCEISEMLSNKAFINSLVANTHRLMAHAGQLSTERKLLDELHTLIDANLAITH